MDIDAAGDMTCGEFRFNAGIDEFHAFGHGILYFLCAQSFLLWHFEEQRTVDFVEFLHHGEVLRRFRLVFEEEVGESGLIVLETEGPVTDFLISNGGAGYSAECFTAGGARTVSGPYLNMVGQVGEAVDGLVHLLCAFVLCAFHTGGFFEQVGATDITDEYEVTGEEHHGFGTGRGVGQQEADAFRCMAGGVEHIDFEVAHHEGIVVFQTHMVEFIFPAFAAFIGEVKFTAGEGGQFTRTGEEVGVDMRFHDMCDAHIVLPGDLEIGINISFRVDHGGDAGLLASDKIAGLCQGFVVNVLEEHGLRFLWKTICLVIVNANLDNPNGFVGDYYHVGGPVYV